MGYVKGCSIGELVFHTFRTVGAGSRFGLIIPAVRYSAISRFMCLFGFTKGYPRRINTKEHPRLEDLFVALGKCSDCSGARVGAMPTDTCGS